MNEKNELLGWACTIIKDHVDKEAFGTITVAMANGKISGVKTEINQKPSIDQTFKNP